jgi:hypothetical protein
MVHRLSRPPRVDAIRPQVAPGQCGDGWTAGGVGRMGLIEKRT